MTTISPEIQALREEIQKKTGKTPEELYAEREKRLGQAVNLEKPDRVPIVILADPAEYADIPRSAAYYDPVRYTKAVRQFTIDFDPDTGGSGFPSSGTAMELLDVKNRQWPGGSLPDNSEYQFVELELMKADEYEIFFKDPTDFMLRYYLPRMYGVLAPLAKLPYLGYSFNSVEGLTGLFNTPEWEEMAARLKKAGQETKRFRELVGNTGEEMVQLGYPSFSHFGPGGGAPFDTVSSFLRGMQGAMTDMYRQPENLLKLCDMIQEQRLSNAQPAPPTPSGFPRRLAMPLWRGDASFMSQKHFERFYWPGLKKQLLELHKLGYIPMPVFEDYFGERLRCLLELPKGSIAALVDSTDVFEISKMMRGHVCVIGGGPHSHVKASIQEVEDYNKRVIDECAPEGGFILVLRLPAGQKKEDVRAMIERLKEYGKY